MQTRESTLALKPRVDITRSPKRVSVTLQKVLMSSIKLETSTFLSVAVFLCSTGKVGGGRSTGSHSHNCV